MGFYRSLLRRVAPTLDREHGDAVEEMFDTRRREVRGTGRLRLVWFWAREVAGLLKAGASERALEQRRTRRQMLREKRMGATMLETIMRDLQFTMRLMRRSPGFTAVVLLTLAVGIGPSARARDGVPGQHDGSDGVWRHRAAGARDGGVCRVDSGETSCSARSARHAAG